MDMKGIIIFVLNGDECYDDSLRLGISASPQSHSWIVVWPVPISQIKL